MPDSSAIRRRTAATLAALALTGVVLVPAATAAEPAISAEAATGPSAAAFEQVELSALPHARTAIRSGAPDSAAGFGFDGDRFVGQCVGEGDLGCAADDVQRVVFDFGDLGSPDALADLEDGVIRSAYLTLDVVQDQQCGVQGVTVHAASAVTDASTWNSTSLYRALSAPLSEVGCGGARQVPVDVTALVRLMVGEDRPFAFGLRAADEDCRGCGRASFGPGATLDVALDLTDTVTDPQTSSSGIVVPCVSGSDRPGIRSRTPALSAVLTNEREPFTSDMAAVFTVRDLADGEEIQRVQTRLLSSGSRHSMTVASGLLEHAGTYAWSVQALLPSGRLGDPVTCEFFVDNEAPGVPTITPAEGYPAAYLADTVSGGPFVPGAFALSATGDVDHFTYELSTGEHGEVAPGEPLEIVPQRSGATRLTVRATDTLGNSAASAPYEFYVGFPATIGRWLFNEGSGFSAAGDAGGPVLGLTGDDLWGPGALADFDPADFGLTLDGPADRATSAGQLADPQGIVTLSALVKPVNSGPGRIVAQGGDFELAVVTDPGCPTPSGTCWVFIGATGAGAERTTVYADAEPAPGVWNTVTAIRNPYTADVRMYFCRSDVWERPREVAQAPIEPLDAGSGEPLVVGGSSWRGTVDNVRVLSGAPDEDKVLAWCNGSTGP